MEVLCLLTWQPSYHSNEVCADAFHPKEAPYQILTQLDLKEKSYGHFTLVAMVPELP